MNTHGLDDVRERLRLEGKVLRAYPVAAVVGVVGVLATVGLSLALGRSLRGFYFAYLGNLGFFLSLALGALFFVLLQHVTRAGWSVNVRRLAEVVAATLPVLAILALPIVGTALSGRGQLYPWAQRVGSGQLEVGSREAHAEGDPTSKLGAQESHSGPEHAFSPGKRLWLTPAFFTARVVTYLLIWSVAAMWYLRRSAMQDRSGDPSLTRSMEKASGFLLVVYGVTVTLASFDLFMSLDPHWYSTIFGVYYFSGCAIAIFAVLVVLARGLQRLGYLSESITTEHYHDLGKLLFAFVFFWGYIAFSQYMLIWYGNIPEETAWYIRRGASTVRGHWNAWTAVSVMLLVCHLLIPFAALLSRQAKRRAGVLLFWAGWMLVFHWVDVMWLVLPEAGDEAALWVLSLTCLLGLGGIFVAALVRIASRQALRPVRDPRLEESMVFENV